MAVKKKAAPKKASTSPGKERPPQVDRLLKPAVGVGLALLAYQFFKGINAEIPRVNLEDELELRQIFFGEGVNTTVKNFAVLCHDSSSSLPVSSVFQEASTDSSAPAAFRLLDCQQKLSESGKTVFERFKLNEKQRPVVFVSGAIGPPKQVPSKHLKTGTMLVKALKNLLEPKAEKIETTQDLRSKCLEKERCGLLLKGGKVSPKYVKDAMAKLVVEHPRITFAAVDTSVLYIKNLEDMLPEFESGVPRFVMFQKLSGSTDVKSSERLKTSMASLPTAGVAYGPMSNLVAGVVSGTETMKKLSTLPTVKTRTKKLVQEEKAKRQRKVDQQQRAQGGGSTGGSFTANDGSAEGRRLERERRRAEHRASNPNYKPKTPEEIAEMERQRRLRMEAEAAKWNVAPEDAPEEGEPVGEEYNIDMDDADGNDDVENVNDEGDEDDEEIMDLD